MVYNKYLLRMFFQAYLNLTEMLNAAVYKYSLLVMAATLEIKIRSIQWGLNQIKLNLKLL